MLELLLESNANPAFVSENGDSAYTIARDSRRLINAALVAEACAIRGILDDDTDLVLQSIKDGAHVNLRTEAGWNPLIFASAGGHTSLVQELLSLKANPNHVENEGWSPLHFAAVNGHADIVKMLLDAGAHVDERNNKDKTARELGVEFSEVVDVIDAFVASNTDL